MQIQSFPQFQTSPAVTLPRPHRPFVQPSSKSQPQGVRFGDGGLSFLIVMGTIIASGAGAIWGAAYSESLTHFARKGMKELSDSIGSGIIERINEPVVRQQDGVTVKRYDIKVGATKYTVTETQEIKRPKTPNVGFYVKPSQILTSFKLEPFSGEPKQPSFPIVKYTSKITDKQLEKQLQYTCYMGTYQASKGKTIKWAEQIIKKLQQHSGDVKLELMFQSSEEAIEKMTHRQ